VNGPETMNTPEEVLPGIFRVEVPLPGSPLKSINSWVIPSAEGRNLVVDTGMLRSECATVLLAGLAALEVDPGRTDVFITHIHADHSALAGVLAVRGATLHMEHAELALLRDFEDRERFFAIMGELGRRAGLSEDEILGAARLHPGVKYSPPKTPPIEPVEAGSTFAAGRYRFTAVSTPGHSPNHLCLWEPEHRILISGDHILGDITPNITSWPGVEDSLGDYLSSLEETRKLGARIALPGHRTPIRDVAARITELQVHHEERLAEVLRILASGGPQNVCSVASQMTWDIQAETWEAFPLAQKWFACGEAAAHLDHLVVTGRARVEDDLYSVLPPTR